MILIRTIIDYAGSLKAVLRARAEAGLEIEVKRTLEDVEVALDLEVVHSPG
jgi:hypothetical protein